MFLKGFLLSLGLIVAIGAQNAFVLRQGLLKNQVFTVCLVASLGDALLIAVGALGLGEFISRLEWVKKAALFGGALFLAWFAFNSFKSAVHNKSYQNASGQQLSVKQAITVSLGFIFLNPHVFLDTILLIGSVAASQSNRLVFALGAMTASVVWFFGLGYGARLLIPLFQKPATWKILDTLIGTIMSALAISLLLSALQ